MVLICLHRLFRVRVAATSSEHSYLFVHKYVQAVFQKKMVDMNLCP
jgi:hypothetical protein